MKKLIFWSLFMACLGAILIGLSLITVAVVAYVYGAAGSWAIGLVILSGVMFLAAWVLYEELERRTIADAIKDTYKDAYGPDVGGSVFRSFLLLACLWLGACNEHSTEPIRHACAVPITVTLDSLAVHPDTATVVCH